MTKPKASPDKVCPVPVYLSDLNDIQQEDLIRTLKDEERTDILKAIDAGDSIIIGYYLPLEYCEAEWGLAEDEGGTDAKARRELDIHPDLLKLIS